MKGFVDDQWRALLRVPVSASRHGDRTEVLVWIDTAFNGGLLMPQNMIAELKLAPQASVDAILADGNSVELPMFSCFLDWFGNCYETEVASSDAKFALLGTMLLANRDLHIDYRSKSITLR
jgi:clan AA aspartic protease